MSRPPRSRFARAKGRDHQTPPASAVASPSGLPMFIHGATCGDWVLPDRQRILNIDSLRLVASSHRPSSYAGVGWISPRKPSDASLQCQTDSAVIPRLGQRWMVGSLLVAGPPILRGEGGPRSLLSPSSHLPPLAASVESWGYRLCQEATHLTLLGNHRIGGGWSPSSMLTWWATAV